MLRKVTLAGLAVDPASNTPIIILKSGELIVAPDKIIICERRYPGSNYN